MKEFTMSQYKNELELQTARADYYQSMFNLLAKTLKNITDELQDDLQDE